MSNSTNLNLLTNISLAFQVVESYILDVDDLSPFTSFDFLVDAMLEQLEERTEQHALKWPQGWRSVLSHTHTYSGRDDHGGSVPPAEAYQQLASWTARCGIDAVAMGSPYTPKSASNYGKYDGPDRDRYYRSDFDKLSVLDDDEIEHMLNEIARVGGGRTLFYLDNETPKGRYGHMWWLGYHADFPAWHDYDQPFDRWMVEQTTEGDHCDEPMPYERRPYLQILAAQRSRGALGFWAHPTSWWRGDKKQFITNIATEMPAHAIAEGFIDGLVVMGYHPYRPQYQDLWFEMLDRGYRMPGVAEMDCGLSDPKIWRQDTALLTYARHDRDTLTVRELTNAFRRGEIFASSGPFVDLTVDQHRMGEVVTTSPQHGHRVRITAYPATGKSLGRVELLGRGGKVLWRRSDFTGGTIDLLVPGLGERGYYIARVFGSEANGKWREVQHTAVSNPVYLHPKGEDFNAPATTKVEIRIGTHSPFVGGDIRFESMSGELLGATIASIGSRTETLPASARVKLVAPDGQCRTDYLINANAPLQAVQRYLYRGKFLLDYPTLQPGEVPPEAWQLDRYVDAMREMTLTYE